MTSHFLAIHHESYDASTVFGVFDSMVAARDHLEAEAAKPDSYSSAEMAEIEEWDGDRRVATYERNYRAPRIWDRSLG